MITRTYNYKSEAVAQEDNTSIDIQIVNENFYLIPFSFVSQYVNAMLCFNAKRLECRTD